jgi:chorismate mutase
VTDGDERFDELRRLIAENDRTIVAAVNERLRLVDELWRLKGERGDARLDPERERRLREQLRASNEGPLSAEGVDRLVGELLELTKRELAGEG